MESARVATAAELAFVAELWERAVAELDGPRGGSLLAGTLYRADPKVALESAFDDPDRLLVIGSVEGVPVGFASATCDRQRREPVAVIDIVYVEPEAREVGVAEAIVKVVMDWSAELGCVGVDAPALPGNRSAKAFFEDNGFIARLLIMHRPVGGKKGGGDG